MPSRKKQQGRKGRKARKIRKAGREKKKIVDREFLFMLALFIVSAAVIVGIVAFILSPAEQPVISESASVISITVTPVPTAVTELNRTACLARYGLKGNDIVFVYSDTCSFSIGMEPLVQQLEREGYGFFWANVANGSALQIVSSCLSDVAQLTHTPEFICPASGVDHVGAFSGIEELRGFAARCK